jgi:hypothetical protein
MGERIENGHARLFEVRLLHHYWLDEGAVLFDHLPAEKQKTVSLAYNIGAFLSVTPTATTLRALKQCGAIWRSTQHGFFAALSAGSVMPTDTMLEWVVTVTNTEFFNYTALTIRPQTIHELYSEPERTRYRFKENVPVFSNLTGTSRGAGDAKKLFLSCEIEPLEPGDPVESLFEQDGSLCQLTADYSGGPKAPVLAVLDVDLLNMPSFFNQHDIPAIDAPDGLADVPAKGIALTADIPDNIFALIRIAAKRPGDDDFSLTDDSGYAKAVCPVFQLRFRNRLTWWKRIDQNQTESLSATPLPLTCYGNASGVTGPKPSAGTVKAEMDGDKAITKLFSEIFT